MSAAEYYESLDKETVNCPACGSEDYAQLAKGDRYQMGVESCGCKRCGLIFINPRPTELEMQRFYETSYRKFYESVEKPSSEYVKEGPFIPRANFVVDCISRSFDNDANVKVLDIGCAEGTLLKTIGDRFCNAELHGVEPDPNFSQYARESSNAKIVTGGFDEFLSSNRTAGFDLVTLTHVLEHVLKPNEFLQQIRTVLKPGGILYVEVPNIANENTTHLGHVHLGHVLSLSPPNLRALLTNNGFTIRSEYLDGLPAKTPAMAFVTTRSSESMEARPINAAEIESIFDHFRTKVAMQILV